MNEHFVLLRLLLLCGTPVLRGPDCPGIPCSRLHSLVWCHAVTCYPISAIFSLWLSYCLGGWGYIFMGVFKIYLSEFIVLNQFLLMTSASMILLSSTKCQGLDNIIPLGTEINYYSTCHREDFRSPFIGTFTGAPCLVSCVIKKNLHELKAGILMWCGFSLIVWCEDLCYPSSSSKNTGSGICLHSKNWRRRGFYRVKSPNISVRLLQSKDKNKLKQTKQEASENARCVLLRHWGPLKA